MIGLFIKEVIIKEEVKMSKWLNADKFKDFKNDRQSDNTVDDSVSFARKYTNPKMGTQQKPKQYEMRLLPDPDGNFYKKYMYHMFMSGESWNYIMCPKTHGLDNYCPWCEINKILYQGSSADKKKAKDYKRKEKFVGNVFISKDPRDAEEDDPDRKFAGKTFLYEFPSTVEQKIKSEMVDTENGWGIDIFNPEEGYNLVLKISAKPPDKNKKVWPDYGPTTFSKKPSSIGDWNDGKAGSIDEIMETCQSIDEYIDNSMWDVDKHEALLKSEMVYEDVENNFLRNMCGDKKESKKTEEVKESKKTEEKSSKKSSSKEEISDAELLAELDSL